MVDTNTTKITSSLIYALLEWTLILLLLLNSLFSFLIIKFSQYFALKPPCLWCSTLHRFLDPQNINSHRNLLCEFHSKEVSTLGFCPNHKKLAQIKGLCQDCFSSHLGFQSEVKQSSEDEHKCSCCGFKIHKKSVDGDLVMDLMKENLEIKPRKEDLDSNCFEIETHLNQFEKRDDLNSDFVSGDLEFFFDYSGSQLVPIELVDSSMEESQNVSEADEETENSLVFNAKFVELINEESAIVEETRALFINFKEHEENDKEIENFDPDSHLVHEEAEVSIGTWIPIHENGTQIKEPRIPETPGSISSLDRPEKRLLTIERKESGAEESFDGSVMSDGGGDDPIATVEKLKSALKAERKALHALYAELEAERGASAVAASETMAMINRLQEEKAAVQMEALHYQRMMEEQSEYDQEALQLLNDLMIKREKELESCRKKVAEFEAKERMRFSNSASCSHSEDGDRMPVETNDQSNGNRDDDSGSGFLDLESSLTDFEKERLSILEQLKVLEVKLFALSDEEDPRFADVRPVDDFSDENGELSGNGFGTIDSAEKTVGDLFDIGIEIDDKAGRTAGLACQRLNPLNPAGSRCTDWEQDAQIFAHLVQQANASSSIRRSKAPNIDRGRVEANARLMADYFDDNPTYPEKTFKRRFRMSRNLFIRIVYDLYTRYPYFQQQYDATGLPGLSPYQKCTAAIRQLAYGITGDAWDDYVRMGESTARKCLNHFVEGIIQMYGKVYLRKPTYEDIQQLYAAHDDRHGFPGMLGSLDCMHWEWAMCPVAWQGQYHRGDKPHPSIILEAAASQDTWIWHAFFGCPGAMNDLNVLNHSPIFEDVYNGIAPDRTFQVNGATYRHEYYLGDGIYHEWATFVKAFSYPEDDKRIKFKGAQEAARKDIERAFGILRKRWNIIKQPSRFMEIPTMRKVMYACIILHNMILENKNKAICVVPNDIPDPPNPQLTEEQRMGNIFQPKVTESNGFHSDELENGKKRFEIEEEVDHVYERLQALEADREFLKHCVGSLKKGDKGMELLQEILQHLRNLRTMDDIHQ
ncbi:hypothetical protein OSB04_021488 [Centaurea solstitialis]|uniref:GTD-binding domain-containing protein n=1 Tax=Centaurea solstitialis TaxID=347529 RepID=A0AA38WE85_9ASTR|nr:hypothetical protein OSB04_021488 [Centaurea solstitialis]